jgi:hypothetical protein
MKFTILLLGSFLSGVLSMILCVYAGAHIYSNDPRKCMVLLPAFVLMLFCMVLAQESANHR